MATGLANSSGLTKPVDAGGERVIEAQLRRAGRYVKWVEAGSQLLTLIVATLIFFFAAALIDHWIISLGWFGRWLLCLAFVGGSGWFVVTRILPLFIRRVNPTYSARAIEEAAPTLKNSLVNFLLLKDDRAAVKQSVLHALETRAANDISTIEVDTAIDRAPLIRIGYILCGVMAVVALYKIASPKDPFQTAARVVAPWADLARPSRVIIREVQPGHTSVYLGSTVEVTADVRGARGKDDVRLIYSTADGQVRDRAVVMKNTAGGNRFVATLPATDEGGISGATGLQQGVQYHVEAGDAVSSIYEIRVRMAPTISVERAELNFPAYTQKPPLTQDTGEIKALEGTRVTIHARANQPIKSAKLEFDPRPGRTAESIALQVEGQTARGTFTLQLKPDRATPWRESYQVRFTNEHGEISEQPVIHRLEVTPDLPPEVEILQPRLQKIDLAADGRLTIEARGVDPDFALFDLHVAGKLRGQELFRKALLPPGEPRSQATGKFEFIASQYNLKAGDVVTYQAIAVDNRRDPRTGQPQPGRAQTAEYTINIIAPRKPNPNETQNPNADPNAKPNDPNQQPQPNNDQPMPKPGEQRPQDPMGKQPPMPGEQQPPMPGEEQPNQQPNGQPEDQKPGQEQKSPGPMKPQDQPKTGNQKNGESDAGQSGSGQGESTQGAGNQAQPGSGSGQSNNNSQPNNQQPMPGESQGSDGNQGSQSGGSENQPGQSGEPTAGGNNSAPGNNAATNPSDAGNAGDPAGDPSVRPGEAGGQTGGKKPEHDGEKFEKLLEHLKKELEEQKQNEGAGNNRPSQESPTNSSQNPNQQQPSGQTGGKPGDQQSKDNQGQENEVSEQLLKDLEQYLKEKQAQENAQGGKSPNKPSETAQESGKPMPQPMPAGKQDGNQSGQPMPQPNGNQSGTEQNGDQSTGAQQPMGQSPMGQPPMTGQQGTPQKGAGQQPNETKGGSPQGPPRTDEGKEPSKQGEQKKPGAGQNGNPGAGDQSQDPTGSGQAEGKNQDKPKDMQPGEGAPEKANDPSAPSNSNKTSDSKGGASGDQSGGGKQGAGQSGGQQGNDSAGGSSPGDEGAGRANEQGQGETGDKGGKGPEAAGKTGQPGGKKPGEGTATKAGEKGNETGKGGEPGKEPGKQGENEPGGSSAGGNQTGPGRPTGAGTPGDRSGQGITNKSADAADEANLNYTRKATDLVLQYLRDQEHNPDPELAKRSNMTPQEIQEFTRRWNQLKKDAEADPEKARELDEALRSLGMKHPKNRRRSESSTDKQRDLRDAGGRTQAPPKYREQFDQFRKSTGLGK